MDSSSNEGSDIAPQESLENRPWFEFFLFSSSIYWSGL